MGLRCKTVSRNTLSNANATRPWQIYADFAQHLIAMARPLYAKDPLAIDLDATVYAFDVTTIDLCLSVYPWAPFRAHKAAIKLHTLLDLRGSIPTFIHISDGKTHEVNTLDLLHIEPGAYYLLDRGYLDFQRRPLPPRVAAWWDSLCWNRKLSVHPSSRTRCSSWLGPRGWSSAA